MAGEAAAAGHAAPLSLRVAATSLLLPTFRSDHVAHSYCVCCPCGRHCCCLFLCLRSHRTYSYTHTLDELSLLLEKSSALAAFPPQVLQGNPQSWRALEIVEGPEILDTPGIVSSICGPLLRDESVAHELLYLSTYSSDVILVREGAVRAAAATVSANLSFLLESRRRAHEELAKAELREAEEAAARRLMEEEDRARANAQDAGDEADADAEAETDDQLYAQGEADADAFGDDQSRASGSVHMGASRGRPSRVPGAGATSHPSALEGSLSSSISSMGPDIFQFDLRSTRADSPAPSEAALARPTAAATAFASHLYSSPREAGAPTPLTGPQQPRSLHFSPAASSASLQQLHLEAEGSGDECGGDADETDGRIDMHLSKLPFRLVLLTFHAEHLPQCTHAILYALMHSSASMASHSSSSASAADAAAGSDESADGSASAPSAPASLRPCFFSFTQAGSEISLIIEAEVVDLCNFPSSLVTRHSAVWCAVQVSQGSEAAGDAGASLVAPLSAILARNGYSIYYLSTANLDYVLVAEREVERAIAALTRDMHVMVDS